MKCYRLLAPVTHIFLGIANWRGNILNPSTSARGGWEQKGVRTSEHHWLTVSCKVFTKISFDLYESNWVLEYVALLPEEVKHELNAVNNRNATTLFLTELMRGIFYLSASQNNHFVASRVL